MKRIFTTLLAALSIAGSYAQQTVGLFSHTAAAEDGYVLFAPMFSKTTYLIDKCGKQVHTWATSDAPGCSVYLLPDGSLLRPSFANNPLFTAGGTGGRIEILDWNSNVTWSYTVSSATECQHHDVSRMPNGNILILAWELKTEADALAAGRDPSLVGSAGVWSEKIMEVQPIGSNGGKVVWQWKVWDHLIQDRDPALPNYGVIADHPELIDINHSASATNPDWLHLNSVAYNADRNEIMLCSYYFNELWIIDHSTTSAQSTTHTGGGRNKGGDLLYRWGNPEAYDRGGPVNRELFNPHDPHWITSNSTDRGKIIMYNNGQGRPGGSYSTVDIIEPPIDAAGNYMITAGVAYGPSLPSWQYKAPNPFDFYSAIISGANRLANRNTLICEGTKGKLFEVDTAGNIVWEYVNPVVGPGPLMQGATATQNYVFRCNQYPATYSGFAGQTLTPTLPIELNPLPTPCFLTTGVANAYQGEMGIHAANPFDRQIVLTSEADSRNVHAVLINSLGVLCGAWDLNLIKGVPAKLETSPSLAQGLYMLRVSDGMRQSTIKILHN